MTHIQLFDTKTIDTLPWPDNPDGDYAKRFLVPFIKNGPGTYINNVKTTMYALLVDDMVLPVTVNDAEYDGAYVTSLHAHYVDFARDELRDLNSRTCLFFIKRVLSVISKLLRYGEVNKVVYVNNWLLPTNLYPNLSRKQIAAITVELRGHFPSHALAWRSINSFDTKGYYDVLRDQGFRMIASRQVFYTDTSDEGSFRSRMFKSDLKVLKNNGYNILRGEKVGEHAYPRLRELYENLYLKKYSRHNLQFNDCFFQLAVKNQLLDVKILEKNGQYDGIVGYFSRNGTVTSPLFGYDTTLPAANGLYRSITTVLALEAKEKGWVINQSAGAASFKRLRRAKSDIEYTAVFYKHLSARRKWPWKILAAAANGIGIPLMKRFDL